MELQDTQEMLEKVQAKGSRRRQERMKLQETPERGSGEGQEEVQEEPGGHGAHRRAQKQLATHCHSCSATCNCGSCGSSSSMESQWGSQTSTMADEAAFAQTSMGAQAASAVDALASAGAAAAAGAPAATEKTSPDSSSATAASASQGPQSVGAEAGAGAVAAAGAADAGAEAATFQWRMRMSVKGDGRDDADTWPLRTRMSPDHSGPLPALKRMLVMPGDIRIDVIGRADFGRGGAAAAPGAEAACHVGKRREASPRPAAAGKSSASLATSRWRTQTRWSSLAWMR